jgi:hypothetical protein
LSNTYFIFYNNGNRLRDNSLFNFTNVNTLFSTNILNLYFGYSVIYIDKISPYIFKNSFIKNFFIYGLCDTFLRRNLLLFENENTNNNNNSKHLNCTIEYINLVLDNVAIDDKILNLKVLENVKTICISGRVKRIENNFLYKFKYLNKIYLRIKNMRDFFHKINFNWLRNMNNNSLNLKIDLYIQSHMDK